MSAGPDRDLRSPTWRDAAERQRFMRAVHEGSRTLEARADENARDIGLVEALIEDVAEADDAIELAVFEGDRMLALGQLAPVTRAHARMRHRCEVSIGVLPGARRQGLGRLVLAELLRLAPGMGYERAELSVSAENAGAIALYEGLGLSCCGRVPEALRFEDGTYADELRMTIRLEGNR